MEGLRVTIKGWEDGVEYERQVETTDRWVLHTAEELTMTFDDDKSVTIKQQVSHAELWVVTCSTHLWKPWR